MSKSPPLSKAETHSIGRGLQTTSDREKSNWMQGYIEAQHNAARGVDLDALEAWKDVHEQEGTTRQGIRQTHDTSKADSIF